MRTLEGLSADYFSAFQPEVVKKLGEMGHRVETASGVSFSPLRGQRLAS